MHIIADFSIPLLIAMSSRGIFPTADHVVL